MSAPDSTLINQLARCLQASPRHAEAGTYGSIFGVAASAYRFRAERDELTQPTGFDPQAARLFEAILESAYLVSNAGGEFDESRRVALVHLVLRASTGMLRDRQLQGLLEAFRERLAEEGLDRRLESVARSVEKPEHAREVVRAAALLAGVSGGLRPAERGVLQRLSARLNVDDVTLTRALQEASSVLSGR